jgi:hypothetical protein
MQASFANDRNARRRPGDATCDEPHRRRRLDIGTAGDGDRLWDCAFEQGRLRERTSFRKAPKATLPKVIDDTAMQVVGLHFGSNNPDRLDRSVEVRGKSVNVIDNLVDAPCRDNVGNGGDHITIGDS